MAPCCVLEVLLVWLFRGNCCVCIPPSVTLSRPSLMNAAPLSCPSRSFLNTVPPSVGPPLTHQHLASPPPDVALPAASAAASSLSWLKVHGCCAAAASTSTWNMTQSLTHAPRCGGGWGRKGRMRGDTFAPSSMRIAESLLLRTPLYAPLLKQGHGVCNSPVW